jgi:aryl-alcohol dehydrogenase-like predicted oxidoreductase
MKYRVLGRTGFKVSVIGLGTHQFSGEWAKTFSQSEVEKFLERAQSLGINLLDTAECYGDHSVEELVGKSLENQREKWIVATKFGHVYNQASPKTEAWSPSEVRRQLEDSLRALKTDYIDIYQFHSGGNKDFFNDKLWEMLREQVSLGKVRFLALSLAGDLTAKSDLKQLQNVSSLGIDVVQVLYNRLHPEAEEKILPYCENHNLGVLTRVPLAKGFLSGSYKPGAVFPQDDTRSTYSAQFNDEQLRQVEEIKRNELPLGEDMAGWALRWCLKKPVVSSVIVGCKSIEQLELNAAAVV